MKKKTVKTGFKIFNVFPKGVGLEHAVKTYTHCIRSVGASSECLYILCV